MFVLMLNDMRSSNIENLKPVVRAETAEEIESFLERETVDNYRDDRWSKVYKQGGPLEWYNPPWSFEQHIIDVGTEDDWVNDAIEAYQRQIIALPTIV